MSNIATVMAQASSRFTPPTFVGFAQNSSANGGSITVNLAGIPIQSGDMILAAHMVGAGADRRSSMTLSSTGYTLITSIHGPSGYNVNLETYAKIADGTETSFVTNSTANTTDSVIAMVIVIRNANSVLPTTYATGLEASGAILSVDDVTWPAVSGEGIFVYFANTAHITGVRTYADPGDMDGFLTTGVNDSYDVTGGLGYVAKQTGSFTANTWLVSGSGSTSGVAYTVFKLSRA